MHSQHGWRVEITFIMMTCFHISMDISPDNKVHGANIGPTRGRQDPGGPHVGPMNLVIWKHVISFAKYSQYTLFRYTDLSLLPEIVHNPSMFGTIYVTISQSNKINTVLLSCILLWLFCIVIFIQSWDRYWPVTGIGIQPLSLIFYCFAFYSALQYDDK